MMLEGPMESGSFDEAYNHSDLESRTKWRSAMDKELRKLMCANFGRKLENLRFLMVVNVSKANGCLRSNEMVCFELNWLVGTAKFRISISMTPSLRL
jgi:hypothetical protein